MKTTKNKKCVIKYHDIGDYITRERKLKIIQNTKSIQNIKNWNVVKPDKHHDWVDQRNDQFTKYASMGTKNKEFKNTIFKIHSLGLATSRDNWAYNSSIKELSKNMKKHIDYCNNQNLNTFDIKKIDSKQAKWTGELSKRLRGKKIQFDKNKIRSSLYRPFFKQNLYFDSVYNHRIFKMFKFFPERYSKNLAIVVPYKYINFAICVYYRYYP